MNLMDLMVKVGVDDQASVKLDSVGNKAKSTFSGIGVLGTAAGTVVATAFNAMAGAIGSSMDSAVSRVDTLNQYPKVMQQMGYSAEEAQSSMDRLSEGIQGLPTTLDSIATNAKTLALSSGDLDTATDAAIALNDAFLASGATSEQAAAGMNQYTQMLSKGTVDLESWRSLQQNMGFALRETAEAMGYTGESATNDLYAALQSGEVTFDDFQEKLIECDQAEGGFAETAGVASEGIQTSMQNVESAVTRNLANVIDAFNESGVITDAASGIQSAVDELGAAFAPMAEEAGEALSQLGESVSAAFEEGGLEAAVQEAVGGVGELLSELLGSIGETLPDALSSLWDGIYDTVVGLGEGLTEALPSIIEGLLGIIDGMAEFFQGNGEAIDTSFGEMLIGLGTAVLQQLPNILASLGNLLVSMVQFLISNAGNFLNVGIQFLVQLGMGIIQQLPNIISFVASIPGMILSAIGAVGSLLLQAGISIINGLKNGIVNSWSNVNSWLGGLPGKILSAIGDVGSTLFDAGKSIIDGFFNGLKSAWDNVIGWVSGRASEIAANKGPIEYDRKLLIPHGKAIMDGLAEGLETGFGGVTSLVGGMADRMAGAFGSPQLAFGAAGGGTYAKRSVGSVNVYLQYHAGESANQLALDFAAAIDRQNLLEG